VESQPSDGIERVLVLPSRKSEGFCPRRPLAGAFDLSAVAGALRVKRERAPTNSRQYNGPGRFLALGPPVLKPAFARLFGGAFSCGPPQKRTPSSFMLGGSLSRCLKCGLLVGRRGVSGDGGTARPSPLAETL
jgi:hypothetical protein